MHHGGVDVGLAGELPDLAEALALQAAKAPADFLGHAAHHLAAEGAVRTILVALDADVDARIDDDGHRQGVPAARKLDPGLAVGGADVGGVDHRQPAVLEAYLGDGADQLEGVGADALVGVVVGHQAAAIVRRDHFRRLEVPGGEGGLARTGGADQDDQ